MTLEIVSADQIARSFGLIASDGRLSRRGLAQILRSYSSRQGMVPRHRLLRHAREQIAAARLSEAFPPDITGDILDELVGQGDYQQTAIGHQTYVVPSMPRWIPIGNGRAALVGIADVPASLRLWTGGDLDDVVRRCEVEGEDDHAALRLSGFTSVSWVDWLNPLGYVAHMMRRVEEPIRSDLQTLSSFWSLLNDNLAREGEFLSADARVRYLTGRRGGFFGRRDTPACEGRWSETADNGVWCAYRKGFGEAHWHPVIIAVDGTDHRCMDLFDHDEWKWAVLAKAEADGQREIVIRSENRLSVSFPPPKQLLAAMDLLGRRTKPWEWEIATDAPDIWTLVR